MNTFLNKGLLTIALASLLLMSACSDVLDVRNEGQLSTEAALSDARSVNVAMSGIYATLQGTLGSGIPASPTEALAGDIVYAGSDYGYLEIWTQNMSLFTPSFSGFWDNSYRGINAINNVIVSLPDIKDLTEAQKSQIEGECKCDYFTIMDTKFREKPKKKKSAGADVEATDQYVTPTQNKCIF